MSEKMIQEYELSQEMAWSIKRVQEKLALEEFPAYTLLEQFAYLLCIRMQNRNLELSPFDLPIFNQNELEQLNHELELLKYRAEEEHFLRSAKLIENRSLLLEIWNLTSLTLREHPTLTWEDMGKLKAAAEYILENTIAKSKHYFVTPKAVADAMCQMVKGQGTSFWDPACGSGRFLTGAYEQLGQQGGLYIEGTDLNIHIIQAAKIMAYFHGIPQGAIQFSCRDSLAETVRRQYDVILSNPPVTTAAKTGTMNDQFKISTNKLHLQFLQLVMEAMSEEGVAGVLVNESVLFGEMRAEYAIRQRLLDEYRLYAVISLPQGAFSPYTGAKASILFFGKREPEIEGVFFYELKNLGYSLNGKRAPIEENDIPDMLEKWENRKTLYRMWEREKEQENEINEYHVEVPAGWMDERCWFADYYTIREQDYSLSGDVYAKTVRDRRVMEPPEKVLEELWKLERQTEEKLMELMEMMREYE